MSGGIVDERVVQMRFDNEQFEKGVSSSMASLKNLNKTIDELPNTSKNGFSKLADSVKGFSMEAMGSAIENIEHRFSTLGIIGATVIQNLTNTVVNGAKKIVTSAWDGIVTGGFNRASNIEQAKFMLKGLGVAWKDIEADINYGVQDTAYSLDSAAKAAAQLVASSVELGPSMQAALRGISGVAAMTNSDYDSIANIFTTIAGQGKVMTMQLRMLEMRGMNVAANIAKLFNEMNDGTRDTSNMSENFVKMVKNYTKGAQVTEAAIRQMVSDGKMDFEMFSNAMNEAFGDHAKEANNTLTGVLANVKSALAKIGEAFISPVIANEGPLVKFLDQVRAKLNQAKDVIKPFGKAFGESVNTVLEKWGSIISNIDTETFTKIISNIANSIFNLVDAISHVGKFISAGFKSMLPNEDYENKFLSLSEALVEFTGNIDDLTMKIKNIKGFGALGKALYSLLHIVKQFKNAGFDAIKKVFEHFKTGEGTFYRFATNISDFIQGVDKSIEESKIFVKAFDNIADAVIFVGDKVKAFVAILKDMLSNFTFIDDLKEKFGELKDSVSSIGGDKSGEGFSGLKDKIIVIGNGICKALNSIINGVRTAFHGAIETVKNFWEGLKQATGKNTLLEMIFPGDSDDLMNLASGGILLAVSTNLAKFVKSVSNTFRTFTTGDGKTLLGGIGGPITNLTNALKNLSNNLSKQIKIELIKEIATAVIELAIALLILSSIDSDKLASSLGALTISIGELVAAFAGINAIMSGNSTGQTVSRFGNIFNRTVSSITTGVDYTKLFGFLIGFSTAILILSAAMKNLSELNWEEVGKGLAGIGGAMAELSGAMIVISRFSKGGFKVSDVLLVLGIATAMKIMAGPIKELGTEMNWEDIGKGLSGMSVALGALAGVVILMGRFAGGTAGKSVTQFGKIFKSTKTTFASMNNMTNFVGIIAMAGAIRILVPALKDLAEMNWAQLAKAGSGLAGITSIFSGLMMISKLSGGKGMISAGIAMISMAGALRLMLPALEGLSKIPATSLLKTLGAIALLFGVLGALAENVSPKKLLSASSAVLIFAIGLDAMIPALVNISKIPVESLSKTIGAITILMAALSVFSGNIRSAKNIVSASSAILIFAIALDAMSPALLMLGNLDIMQIAQGVSSIVILMAALGVLANNTKGGDLAGTAGSLIIFSTALLILAPALKILSSIDIEGVSIALIAIAGALAIFGIAAAILEPYIKSMVALAGSLALLGAACALAGVGILALGAGLTSLGAGLTVLVGAIPAIIVAIVTGIMEAIKKIASSIDEILPSVKEITLKILDMIRSCLPEFVSTIFEMIMELLKNLATYVPQIVDVVGEIIISVIDKLAEGVPKFISSLSNLVKAFISALATAFEDLNTDELVNALKSMGILSAIFLAITVTGAVAGLAAISILAITGVLALCAKMFGLIANMGVTESIPIMDQMAEVLAKFSEAMALLALFGVAAALNTVTGLIPVVAGLTTVLEALGALKQIPGFEWLLTEGGNVLVKLGDIIGEFIGSIISGGLKALSSGLPEIGKNLSEFFISATPFIIGMQTVNEKVLKGVSILTGAILELTAAEVVSGIASFITGGTSFSDMGKELCAFAPYFVKFANTVKDVDGKTVEASANAALSLAKFASAIPNEGGLIAKITGENSLSKFAEELVKFGPSLLAYSMSVKGVDAESVETSARAALALAKFAQEIPNEGGLVAKITGDNSLSEFAKELALFGPSLMSYAISVRGLNTGDVESSVNAAKMVSEMANGLPNQGGVSAFFAGDNTLELIAAGLGVFGPAIKKYGEEVSGIQVSSVSASVNAAKMITGLIDGMPNQGGIVSWFTGDNTLGKLSAELIIFGENFKIYYETLSNISPEKLNAVTYAIGNLLQSFKGIGDSDSISKFGKTLAKLGEDSIAKFVETFTASSEDVTLAINTMMEYTRSAIDIEAPSVEEKMSQMVGKVINAFKNRYRDGYETCATFITKCLDGLEKHINEFEKIGKNAVAGFIDGMKSKLNDVAKAGDTIGKTAKDATMKALDEHSPSKVYKVIGTNADLGFVEGMEVGLPEVAEAAEKVGLEAITTLLDITDEGIDELKDLLQNGGENLTDTVSEVGDDIQKVSEEKLNKTFDEISKGAKAMAKSLGTSSNAIEIFAKNYVVNSKGIASSSEALTAASKGIAALSISLIENSNKTKKAGEQTKLTLANMKKAYLEYYDSLKSTIEGQIDVFSAFEKKTDMSMETMLSNIKSQLDGVREWGAMLGSLAGKIDDGLMQTLADMGPKGYEYVAALASGTAEQLALYNQYWIESQDVATGVADNLMASMAQNALWVTEGFVNGVNPKAANPIMQEFANNVNSSFKDILGIASPSQIMYNNGMYICQGMNNGLIAFQHLPKGTIGQLSSEIVNRAKDKLNISVFSEIGRNICEGLRGGIESGAASVISSIVSMCDEAISRAKATLDEHSPSKVFRKIGEYIPMGMAEGISNYSKYAVYATEDMAKEAINGFQTAKEQLVNVIDMDIDLNPVIRPTLDLSAVRAGASMLGGMFDNTTIAANARGLQNGSDSTNINPNGSTISFTQNNYSPTALSRTEIYRQTSNQLSHLRGMVNV